MFVRKRKLMIDNKGECRITLPKSYPKNYHLKPSEPMLLLTEDAYSGIFVIIAERTYKTSPYLREKIDRFLAEEVI